MQITKIVTDESLRELQPHGTAEFPFAYYYDDIKKYDIQYVEWHWHREFEFIWVDAGPVDCFVGADKLRLNAGEGLFVNSGVIHRYEARQEGLMPNILFSPEFFAGKDSSVYKKYVDPVLHSGCSHVVFDGRKNWHVDFVRRLQEIYQVAENGGFMAEIRIQALTESLWAELFERERASFQKEKTEGNVLLHSRLQVMMQYIRDNYAKKISLEDIARSAGVSKSEALRCFHAGISTTPVNYLIAYRLNCASRLLVSTSDTVTNIAGEVGFDNVSYFTRIFTRTFGMTPKEFRRR